MDVNETELLEMAEEPGVRPKVIHKIDHQPKGSWIDVGEMDHSHLRGEIGNKEGEFVDEIAVHLRPGVGGLIGLYGQTAERNVENLCEERDLFLFGWKVVELTILEDIIEAKKLGLHIIDLVGAPVSEILVADDPVNDPGI